jgi:hypothetical protein
MLPPCLDLVQSLAERRGQEVIVHALAVLDRDSTAGGLEGP